MLLTGSAEMTYPLPRGFEETCATLQKMNVKKQ